MREYLIRAHRESKAVHAEIEMMTPESEACAQFTHSPGYGDPPLDKRVCMRLAADSGTL
jgi:hypothetical protein